MIARFHKGFERQYKKLRKGEQEKVRKQIALFQRDEFDLVLNNHPLHGKYKGYRSINITGDLRAIYRYLNSRHCLFTNLDTHSNLYK